MLNPYTLRRVQVSNIRSIEHADIELEEQARLYRIGGRNGQGKSTAFYLGLNALLGMIPATPLLSHNKSKGFYEVTNGYGTFGFMVVRNHGTSYYYQLNNGQTDSSDETVNHNPCLEVIRSMLGFELDLDFKTVLNLNSGSELNFIVTNGRTGLSFMKELIYSEEIEHLQEVAVNDLSQTKSLLDNISYQVSYIDKERESIKYVDPYSIEELSQKLDLVRTVFTKAKELSFNLKGIERGVYERNLTTLTLLEEWSQGLASDALKYRQTREYAKAQRLSQSLSTLTHLQSLSLRNQLARLRVLQLRTILPLQTVMQYRISTLRIAVLRMQKGYLEYQSLLNSLLQYKRSSTQTAYYSHREVSSNLNYLLISLISLRKNHLQSTLNLNNITMSHLKNFVQILSDFERFSLSLLQSHFRATSQGIYEMRERKERIAELKEELDGLIYKEGRCILCYSKKSERGK